MTPDTHAAFTDIVLGGTRKTAGMASFKDILTREDADAVHAYLIARAQEDYNDDIHAGTAPAQQAH
jgi:quinohemoprotein ethanol dehydrogenase